jgi:hypothetical protein
MIMKNRFINSIWCCAVILCGSILQVTAQQSVLVETESFANRGGWVIDQQSFAVMGSSYLMAHGMGRPVKDAVTTVTFPAKGKYRVWVRTKDWAPFPKGPGKFTVSVNELPLQPVFGESGNDQWKWYDGGEVNITNEQVKLSMHDLTGFNGRCDALLFTTAAKYTPPNDMPTLSALRRK